MKMEKNELLQICSRLSKERAEATGATEVRSPKCPHHAPEVRVVCLYVLRGARAATW